jgi:hypothetical protein
MCLDYIKTEISSKANKKGLIEGYKVFYRRDIDGKIVSPYREENLWKRGWSCSGRKNPQWTADERYHKCIFENGFYIFLNKSDAMVEAKDFFIEKKCRRSPYFVRKVWFKPEHLICGGTYSNGATSNAECAMVTKLYVRFD